MHPIKKEPRLRARVFSDTITEDLVFGLSKIMATPYHYQKNP
jgi:hypothetical protein